VTPTLKLGTTLYALTNEFLSRRFSFEALLEQMSIRHIGPGLEIVGFQSIRGFPHISAEFADRFRSLVARYDLTPITLGINADQEIRRGRLMSEDEMVAYHEPQIRAAATLGFPIVRYQYGAGPEVIRRLVPLAEKLNVKMGLEIHAPQHANHPDVLKYREMYAKVRSPYLGWIPDFSSTARNVPPSLVQSFLDRGIPESVIRLALEIWGEEGDAIARMLRFKERARSMGAAEIHLNELSLFFAMFGKQPPRSWVELMPEVIHIHGKFYGFAADGQEEAIPYRELLPLFRDHGFRGTMVSEWEGHMYSTEDGFRMIERHQAMCREIWSSAAA
jgi:sugar phosphate isomerase/epimerase